MGRVEFAGPGGEIYGTDVHPLGQRFVDQVDDELAAVPDIALGILVAVLARRPRADPEHDDRRHGADRIEKAERRGIDASEPSTVVASAIGRGTTVLTSSL